MSYKIYIYDFSKHMPSVYHFRQYSTILIFSENEMLTDKMIKIPFNKVLNNFTPKLFHMLKQFT